VRFIIALEQVRQGGWILITRAPDGRPSLEWGRPPYRAFRFGRSDDHLIAAGVTLNKQLSAPIVRRVRADRGCQGCLLRESVQALVTGDLELCKGLLRRLVDATLGFEALAGLTEVHAKSLVRMLGPGGNPTARHLATIIARLASWQGVTLTVAWDRPQRGR
jgi:DNA-binding phage protein